MSWRSEVAKSKGNELFRAGNFVDAIRAFTLAVNEDPNDYLGYSNRCAAFIKLERWSEVIEDCSKCLDLNPAHVKSYARRAEALFHIGKYLEAIEDIDWALTKGTKQVDKMRQLRRDCEAAIAGSPTAAGDGGGAAVAAAPVPFPTDPPAAEKVASSPGIDEKKVATVRESSVASESKGAATIEMKGEARPPAFMVATPVPSSSFPMPARAPPSDSLPPETTPSSSENKKKKMKAGKKEEGAAARQPQAVGIAAADSASTSSSSAAVQDTYKPITPPSLIFSKISAETRYTGPQEPLVNRQQKLRTEIPGPPPQQHRKELGQESSASGGRNANEHADIVSEDEDLEDEVHPQKRELEAKIEALASFIGRSTLVAVEKISLALALFPFQVTWYLARGMARHKLGKLGEAVQDFTTVVQLRAGADNEVVQMALLNRARARADMGDLVGAVDDATSASECPDGGGMSKECLNEKRRFESRLEEVLAGREPLVSDGGAMLPNAGQRHRQQLDVMIGMDPNSRISYGYLRAEECIKVGTEEAKLGKLFKQGWEKTVGEYEKTARKRNEERKERNAQRAQRRLLGSNALQILDSSKRAEMEEVQKDAPRASVTKFDDVAVAAAAGGGAAEAETFSEKTRDGDVWIEKIKIQIKFTNMPKANVSSNTIPVAPSSAPQSHLSDPLKLVKRAAEHASVGAYGSALAECEAAARLAQPEASWSTVWYELRLVRSKVFVAEGKLELALAELEAAEQSTLASSQRKVISKKLREILEKQASNQAMRGRKGSSSLIDTPAGASSSAAGRKALIEELPDAPKEHKSATVAASITDRKRPSSLSVTTSTGAAVLSTADEKMVASKEIANLHLNAAHQAIRDYNLHLAKEEFKYAAIYDPSCTESLCRLSAIYKIEKQWEEVERTCTEALTRDERCFQARQMRAEAYEQQGRYVEQLVDIIFLAERFRDCDAGKAVRLLQAKIVREGIASPEMVQELTMRKKGDAGDAQQGGAPSSSLNRPQEEEESRDGGMSAAAALKATREGYDEASSSKELDVFKEIEAAMGISDLMMDDEAFKLLQNYNFEDF